MLDPYVKWYFEWHDNPKRSMQHWFVFLSVAIFFTFLLTKSINEFGYQDNLFLIKKAEAASVPPGSPLAQGVHPRILFTTNELVSIRNRISQYYGSEFQEFINELNNPASLSSGQKNVEMYWGAMNYAFLAVLDPVIMKEKGFTFSEDLDSSQEFCDRATVYINQMLPRISVASTDGHNDLSAGYPKNNYISTIAAYDWCYQYLSTETKQAVVDAFVAAHNKRWSGVNVQTGGFSNQLIANNQDSANVHQTLGVLAFYGDPYIASDKQQELYDVFHAVWFDRVLRELNYFYPKTSWHEGSGDYSETGFVNFGVGFSFLSSALGTNYIASTPYFYTYGEYVEGNLKPHGLNTGSTKYLERWGTLSGGFGTVDCKPAMLISGMLRRGGDSRASFIKWIEENRASNCQNVYTENGGLWSNGVLLGFVNGNRETSSSYITPPTSNKLGMEEYVFKSGYGPSDSQIVFWARKFKMYGHDSPDNGEFTLHKYGNLILHAGNSKSGDGVIPSSSRLPGGSLLRGSVSVHVGATDPGWGTNSFYQSTSIDPYWGNLGYSKNPQIKGVVLAEDIGNGAYDYVSYDNYVWAKSVVSLSQRDLVYLRGSENKEFVVVFDRMNTASPSTDEKIWRVWVPVEPEFVNGSGTNPRAGKWTSDTSDTVSVTNKINSNLAGYGNGFTSAPTHGKMFIKIQTPEQKVVNFVGGDGMEFQSGDDDGYVYATQTPLTQGNKEYLGWGRIEIRPTIKQAYDNFQNVIQFGDANTLTTMSEVTKVVSTDGKLEGSHIKESSNHWNIMFVRSNSDLNSISSFTYTLDGSGSVKQLLTGLKKNTSYKVYDGATLAGTYSTNGSGNLFFTSSLGSSHTFTITDGGSVTNFPPTVSLSTPTANQTFSTPANITVSATASDSDGTISKVEFYQGATLINTDTTAPYTYNWSNVSAGNYSVTAKAYDNGGSTSVSQAVAVVVSTTVPGDTTAPIISGVVVSSITQTGATISWTTNESSAGSVQYGLTTSYGSTINSSGTVSHSVILSGLTPNTTYNYHITSKDTSNNSAITTNQTFVTLSTLPQDTTSPTVSVTSPSASTVSGSVTVSASASDNVGVTGVQFKLDGSNLGSEDLTSPYSTVWNTSSTINGTHTITAVARDLAGNTKTSASVVVTVSNTVTVPDTTPPTVSITIPSAGSTLSGSSVTVSVSASDNVGVTGVQFKLDGSNLGSEDLTSPYSTVWNTTTVADGSHTLTAIARDVAGNTKTSNGIVVTVTNIIPSTPTPPTPPPSGGGGGGGGGTPTITPLPTPVTPPPPVASGGGAVPQQPVQPQTGVTPTQTPTVKGPNITRTLSVGSKGIDVQELQTYLKSKGYLPTGRADGNFGFLTRDAVQKYQCATLGLCIGGEGTGYGTVGPKTRSALLGTATTTPVTTPTTTTSKLNITRTLYFGMRGTDVSTLQTFLISKGYLTGASATGYFGNLTRQAVQRYQCDKLRICSGSTTTNGYGIVGPKTRGEMGK